MALLCTKYYQNRFVFSLVPMLNNLAKERLDIVVAEKV